MSAPMDALSMSVHREFMILVFVKEKAEFAFSYNIGLCMCFVQVRIGQLAVKLYFLL